MTKQYTVGDYVGAKHRMITSVAFAAGYAMASWPLSYQAHNNFDLARMHFEASRLHDEHIERKPEDFSFKEVQAAREYSKLCYNTAVKESAMSAGCALAVLLPVALLAKRFFTNFKLNREWNNAKSLEKRLREASVMSSE